MGVPDEYYLAKLWALFHDPPDKTISIKDHRDRAKEYFKPLLKCIGMSGDTVFNGGIKRLVDDADRFASSIDRFITHIVLAGGDYSKYPVELGMLKNIYNPKYVVRYDSIPSLLFVKRRVHDAINKLCKSLTYLDELLGKHDPRYIYHLTYALYEPLIINEGVPSLPADTRVPTHTVMDHNSAVAQSINMLFGRKYGKGKYSGYLVYISIPGVHRYISKSRKMGDLWISSYLLSALAWYLVEELVMDLGPDILILPTSRFNPFYIHTLYSIITKGHPDDEIRNIKEIFRECFNINIEVKREDDRIEREEILIYEPGEPPLQAIMPANISLIIPYIEEYLERRFGKRNPNSDDIKKYFEDRLERFWTDLWDSVRSEAKKRDDMLYIYKVILERGDDLQKNYFNRFRERPPFNLRIVVLNIEEMYEKYRVEGFKEYVGEKEYDEKYYDNLFYDYLFNRLGLLMNKLKHVRLDGYANIDVEKYTEEAYERGLSLTISIDNKEVEERYKHCSLCAALPSVVWLPNDYNRDKIWRLAEEFSIRINNEDEMNRFISNLNALIKPGESLCPYCLIKRTLSRYVNPLIKLIFGIELKKGYKIPSHTEVTTIEFKLSLLNSLENSDKMDVFLDNLKSDVLDKQVEIFGRNIYLETIFKLNSISIDVLKNVFPALSEKYDKIYKSFYRKVNLDPLKTIIEGDGEAVFHERYIVENEGRRVGIWRAILDVLKDVGVSAEGIKPIYLYYACIKVDGDNVGKLLSGKVDVFSNIGIMDYVEGLAEGEIADIIRSILRGQIKHHLGDVLNYMISNNRIIVTPSFHSSISKSIMLSAANDMRIVRDNYGFVIYAGGDDLLAITPVSRSLLISSLVRSRFSGYDSRHVGFLEMGNNYFQPMFVTGGRSIALIYSHYLTPLKPIIEGAETSLENYSKRMKLMLNQDCYRGSDSPEELHPELSKDSTTVIYRARSGQQLLSMIPNKLFVEDENGSRLRIILDKVADFIRDAYDRMDSERPIISASHLNRFVSDVGRLGIYLDKCKHEYLRSIITNEYLGQNGRGEFVRHFGIDRGRLYLLRFYKYVVKDAYGRTILDGYPLLEIFKVLKIFKSSMRSG